MTKIIVFTDLHFGQEKAGNLPKERLTKGIAHVAEHNPDAAHIILTGDLTHDGVVRDYETLRDVLAGAPCPVHFMVGNHDIRENFQAVFPAVDKTKTGHVQKVIDTEFATLVLLDTLQAPPYSYPFSHIGVLCADRLAWLDAQLAASEKPCILFLHHPPHDTGFVAMDAIKLGNGPEFYDLIERHGNVQQIVCGHVHRTISGVHRGVPFCQFKSLVGQMPMLFDVMDFHMETDEPAAYGILMLTPDGVLAHTEDFELSDLGAIRRSGPVNAPPAK